MVGTLLISLFMGAINKVTPWGIAEQIGGEVIGAGASIYNNERNIKYQKEANVMNLAENQRNRDFNAIEAAKQRDFEAQQAELANIFASDEALNAFKRSSQFALDMWNKENLYDSPSAQIARLKDAGLNPNLFGGNNVAGSAASVSPVSATPSMAHGASASAGGSIPMQAPVSTTNPAMEMANIHLAESQAKLNEANMDESKERAEDIRQMRQGKLDLQNVQIHCGLATERFTEQQLRNAFKESLKLDKEMQISEQSLRNMQQELSNMKLQGNMTAKELEYFDKRLQSQIALALAQSAAQYGMANVSKKQCELLAEQITHQSIENGLIAIDFGKAFAGAPSSTGLLISSNESEQSYYDWANGDWFNKIWGSDASVPRKLWKTATSYGNWLTHSIGVGMNGSFNMRENKTLLQSAK